MLNLKLERSFPFREFFAAEEAKFNERFSKMSNDQAMEELKTLQTKMMLSEDESTNLFRPFMSIIEEILDPKD